MSKAGDVRDAVAAELQTILGSGQPVDSGVLPNFDKDLLKADGPRVYVRTAGRDVTIDHGYEPTDVLIDVGVVALITDTSETASGKPIEETERERFDEADTLVESLYPLWWKGGDMFCGMAEHMVIDIAQPVYCDFEKLNTDGIFFAVLRITYRDSEDD